MAGSLIIINSLLPLLFTPFVPKVYSARKRSCGPPFLASGYRFTALCGRDKRILMLRCNAPHHRKPFPIPLSRNMAPGFTFEYTYPVRFTSREADFVPQDCMLRSSFHSVICFTFSLRPPYLAAAKNGLRPKIKTFYACRLRLRLLQKFLFRLPRRQLHYDILLIQYALVLR